MRNKQADERGDRARDRVARALEQRLARGQRAREIAPSPGVGELVAGDLGTTRSELLDLSNTDWIRAGPGGDLVHFAREVLRALSDDLDQNSCGFGVDLDATLPELSRHPVPEPPLGNVVREDLAGLGTGLAQRGVLLQLGRNEREHSIGGRIGEVRGERLDICRLPAFDVPDDHESLPTAEQPHRVTGGDRIAPAGIACGEHFDRVVADSAPQSTERALDLGAIGAGDQIDGLELPCHRGTA